MTSMTMTKAQLVDENKKLRDHYDADVAKAVADATAVATARIAELEAKLDIAREKYVVMRDIIRELRAPRAVSRPMTDAQVRYAQRAAEGRALHEANSKRYRTMVAAYVAAHPGVPYTMPQVEAWYAQPAPVDCE
jgi:hypothetical protein